MFVMLSYVTTVETSKMTTAARPTFEPARGGRGKGEGDLSALSKQYSSRDLPGHTKIKYRSVGKMYNLQSFGFKHCV